MEPAHERRKYPRCSIAAEALFAPLEFDLRPAGTPFRGVIRDLSEGGLRLLHTQWIIAPLLAMRIGVWEGKFFQVIQVARSVWRLSHYEYAGPFVTPSEFADAPKAE